MSNQIRVLIASCDDPIIRDIYMDDDLENYQKAVGGYIEVIRLHSDGAIIVNEEGRLQGLQENPHTPTFFREPIRGNFVIVGIAAEEFVDWTYLSPEGLAKMLKAGDLKKVLMDEPDRRLR